MQRALDIQEGEALMRELECDEGAMSYWLHSHRRCRCMRGYLQRGALTWCSGGDQVGPQR